MSWQVLDQAVEELGFFRVYVTPPGGSRTDVTIFREVPTQIDSFASADPYGDATAQITFPQIGVFDDLGNGDLVWFQQFSDVDIYLEAPDGTQTRAFEGFMVSYDWSSSTLQVSCKGALFQVDQYVCGPSYPPAPVAYEVLIAQAFDPQARPHLRTQPLAIEWPDDWNLLAYRTDGVAGVTNGGKVTGYATRNTGAWDKLLTGFVSNLMASMYTSDYADQWTIRHDPGRLPVMCVRFAGRSADYVIPAGTPGVEVSLSRDYTQYANVIYGSGTSVDGSAWSRQTVAQDNTRTGYLPVAADTRVFPDNSPDWTKEIMRAETHVQFEDGMEVTTALKTAQLMLQRGEDPGYTGTITLTTDPVGGSRYLIRAGETIRLQYFAGSGEEGMALHITQVAVSVSGGSVTLTVDSKYRDALTVSEVLARTRDPLTPIKFMQVGRQSILIPDQMAPWSYALGSGYVPKASIPLFSSSQAASGFPFDAAAKSFPPKSNGNFYVGINAAAGDRDSRWTCVPVRMAEKGDIRLTQFALYDRNGNRLAIPFHVAVYPINVTSTDMPYDDNGPSPFIPGAFQKTTQYGMTIDAGQGTLLPQDSLKIGWGDGDEPAGYSPGTKTNGDLLTGLLIDETSWSFDSTTNQDFQQNPDPGQTQIEDAITWYVMFYAEHHDWVYAVGRLYRKEPGTS